MRLFHFIALCLTFFAIGAAISLADEPKNDANPVAARVRAEVEKRFPGARIELDTPIQWTRTAQSAEDDLPSGEILSVSLGDENALGEVPFSVQSRNEQGLHISWGKARFNALVPARVATVRIMPGDAVQPSQFVTQEIDVARGLNHEMRGLILSPKAELARMETRQTILEGQPLLSSEIRKMPDVRRGDPVRIELVSGQLTLSTLGTATEPSFIDKQVHVISQKTKRELIGTLLPGNVVEVRL
ncbi:MAG: flagellar basal body P-ring formation chaperone FlgA [Oligoflexia bacterium]|nr:flagellar basal body P-ring formation chaperone FlgA [Oligoflexia bacterium]